jgi:hypothetical protein
VKRVAGLVCCAGLFRCAPASAATSDYDTVPLGLESTPGFPCWGPCDLDAQLTVAVGRDVDERQDGYWFTMDCSQTNNGNAAHCVAYYNSRHGRGCERRYSVRRPDPALLRGVPRCQRQPFHLYDPHRGSVDQLHVRH